MDQVITYGVIAAIVIFQPEIRRGLEHLGRSSLFKTSKSEKHEDEVMVQSLDKAIEYMAKRKIGAFITIERTTGFWKSMSKLDCLGCRYYRRTIDQYFYSRIHLCTTEQSLYETAKLRFRVRICPFQKAC